MLPRIGQTVHVPAPARTASPSRSSRSGLTASRSPLLSFLRKKQGAPRIIRARCPSPRTRPFAPREKRLRSSHLPITLGHLDYKSVSFAVSIVPCERERPLFSIFNVGSCAYSNSPALSRAPGEGGDPALPPTDRDGVLARHLPVNGPRRAVSEHARAIRPRHRCA